MLSTGLIVVLVKNVIYMANCGISEKCCLQGLIVVLVKMLSTGLIVVLVKNVIYRANCGIRETCYLQG